MSFEWIYIVWAVAIVLFAVFEAVTTQLVSIWFLLGAIAALIAALFHLDFWIQILIFISVTAVALIGTRPLVKKKLNTKIEKTNADRCIGQDAVVIEEINNIATTGQVKADGKVWTARCVNSNCIIPEGSVVKIEKIEGVKLIVSPKSYSNV